MENPHTAEWYYPVDYHNPLFSDRRSAREVRSPWWLTCVGGGVLGGRGSRGRSSERARVREDSMEGSAGGGRT